MGFKCQRKFSFSSLTHCSSHNHTEFFPLRIEQNQPNPLQQDSPIPSLPHKQTLRQLTPGPRGTQLLEDLFRETPKPNEPPIPGLTPSSKPHEDVPTCEPEPEVALTQFMEEPFEYACWIAPPLSPSPRVPPPSTPTPVPSPEIPPIAPKNPTITSPHSHNEAHQ
ncbi:hypothetical protein O181_023408 [Austropuccinia psidii MF-1]|uniref:Uncharacterized protein n=1 Tax=Austropuccinia psidii MF-1 TaxID=1389203 RepID=A0A9Q3CH05_9BASI|nr:hypothetical protein [Austropuccinia psidii MF-1]